MKGKKIDKKVLIDYLEKTIEGIKLNKEIYLTSPCSPDDAIYFAINSYKIEGAIQALSALIKEVK